MRIVCLFLALIIIQLSGFTSEYKNDYIDFYPLYFNALQLSTGQISEIEFIRETNNSPDIKLILDRRQKSQYRIISHLENIEKLRKDKNYYKLNPRMSVFGNLKSN